MPEPEGAPPAGDPTPKDEPARPRGSRKLPFAWALPVLLAAGVGAYFYSPPAGIVVIASAFLAMVGAGLASARRGRSGEPLGAGGSARVVAGSLGTAVLVVISSLIACCVTCFPIGLSNWNKDGAESTAMLGLIVGGVSALLAGGGMAYFLGRGGRGRGGPKPGPEEEIR